MRLCLRAVFLNLVLFKMSEMQKCLMWDFYIFPTHRLSPHLLMGNVFSLHHHFNGTCQFLFLFTEHFVTGIKKPKLTFSSLTQTEIRSLFYSLM